MPVAVSNVLDGPAVFSIPEEKIQIEWQAKGDPNGGDVQYVPDELVKNVQFDKMIRRGIFAIIDTATAAASMDKQTESYHSRTTDAAAAAMASIDEAADNDMVQASCIGPSNRGAGECGEPVPVREKSIRTAEKPVLCPRHVSLAPQFVRIETDKMIESGDSLVPETKWVRLTVAPREQQSK